MTPLKKIRAIKEQASLLPDCIVSEEDFKEQDYEAYKKRRDLFYKLHDDVRKELNAFIVHIFGENSAHYMIHNKIDFITHNGIISNTFNIMTNENWYRGKKELMRLINDIEAELRIKDELENRKSKVWEFGFAIISITLIFFLLQNYGHYIYPFTIVQKIFILLASLFLLLIPVSPDKYKINLLGFLISIIIALLNKLGS